MKLSSGNSSRFPAGQDPLSTPVYIPSTGQPPLPLTHIRSWLNERMSEKNLRYNKFEHPEYRRPSHRPCTTPEEME